MLINSHHTFHVQLFVSRKSHHVWNSVDKYGVAGKATDDMAAHAHCMTKNTNKQYLIISAFQEQLRLEEGASILSFAHTDFVVC
jgi:hypothetical protein